MTFKEEFPSLKDMACADRQTIIDGKCTRESTYGEKTIQNNCLDKQRVKEMFKKILDADYYKGHSRPITKQHYKELSEALHKELGLDE